MPFQLNPSSSMIINRARLTSAAGETRDRVNDTNARRSSLVRLKTDCMLHIVLLKSMLHNTSSLLICRSNCIRFLGGHTPAASCSIREAHRIKSPGGHFVFIKKRRIDLGGSTPGNLCCVHAGVRIEFNSVKLEGEGRSGEIPEYWDFRLRRK